MPDKCPDYSASIALLKEASDALANHGSAAVGDDGPSLEEMIKLTEKEGRCYADDASAHDAQWAYRKIQAAIKILEGRK